LNSQTKLFQTGSFNFKLNHLVIVGVLVLAFSMSFLIRSQPADYGYELMEFDPFFNFRATEYIVENGFIEYFTWNDDKSWYPHGRNVSATSQVMLHTTAAITYQIFGGNSSLYDFTILFPAVIGSLTVIIIFGLVRVFAGTTAGLFASLLFAISLPIILRGTVGWFKSEPLGIFYALFALYLFFSGIRSKNKKIAFSKIIIGGITMTFAMASWGGVQFFMIPLGLFILALPFVRKDHKFLIWSIPLFVGTFLLTALMFERPGYTFVFGLGGISLITPTIFLVLCIFVQKISKDKHKIRNGLFLLFSILIIGSFLVIIGEELDFLPIPSFRYLNALNPFLTTLDPLTDSIAEHSTTNIQYSFLFHSTLMIFSAVGAWFLLSKKISSSIIFERNDMRVFVLLMGITGVYVSSAFIRLEVFASISLIFLTSIGLSILIKEIFKINLSKKKNYSLKISSVIIIFILFTVPLIFPTSTNWINAIDFPPTILNGGTKSPPTTDWLDTLEWIKMNTPENAVFASWWDYGYWIQTLGERASLADNSTVNDHIIKNIAKMLLSSPNDGWMMLQEMQADYVIVFVGAQQLGVQSNNENIYILNGGGDESKKTWFIRIADLPLTKYLESDNIIGTDYFWNETLLGKMIPFKYISYYDPSTEQGSNNYVFGSVALSTKEIKFSDSINDPVKLVYASPSFYDQSNIGYINTVFVYEINKNYVPVNNP
jgi:dolichyl-diphosphooligosaccharide--protein glycosyltransferase